MPLGSRKVASGRRRLSRRGSAAADVPTGGLDPADNATAALPGPSAVRSRHRLPSEGVGRCAGMGDDAAIAEQEFREAVARRLRGYEEVAAVRRAELGAMTEEEAARIADELLQLLPSLPAEPDRGSGLVEQQRLFALVRP